MSPDTESPPLEGVPTLESAAADADAGAPQHLGDPDGWVSARPPRLVEVLVRVLRFPWRVFAHHDLITTSVKRDLDARLSGTLLGWAWPLVHPLFLFGVYYFIFTELLQIKMPDLPADKKAAMGVFMFTGITVWAGISESIGRGTSVIVDNGNLIKKLAFPTEILPLNVTLVNMTTMMFAVIMFVLACFVTPMWPAPGVALVWIPLLLLLQALFTYGLTLLLSTVHVFLRDTVQLIAVLLTIWMFVTPLFWAPQVMPKSVASYMPLIESNPVFHLVQAWRGALMGDVFVPPNPNIVGGYAVSVAAIPGHVGVFTLWAVASFVIGFTFFVLSQRRFADEV